MRRKYVVLFSHLSYYGGQVFLHCYASRARCVVIRAAVLFIGAQNPTGIVDYAAKSVLAETAFQHFRVTTLRTVARDKEEGMRQHFTKTRRFRRMGCADYRANCGIAVFTNRAFSSFFH